MSTYKQDGGMGLRSLMDFNTIMLVAKIFKSKFYPNFDFLNYILVKNLSFIWTSLHHSKWVLDRRILWMIGNGNRVNVWEYIFGSQLIFGLK